MISQWPGSHHQSDRQQLLNTSSNFIVPYFLFYRQYKQMKTASLLTVGSQAPYIELATGRLPSNSIKGLYTVGE